MACKLYVEGFSASLSDQELANLFSAFGTVISAVIARKITGESLCFAEVEMAIPEEAEQASERLHRTHIDGKRMLVFHDVWPASSTVRGPWRSRSRTEDSRV